MLNKMPRFSAEDLAKPKPEKIEVGQVYTVRPDITDLWPSDEEVPMVFPLVIAYVEEEGEYCLVLTMHQLRENAATDDLFLTEEDGPFGKYMVACWVPIVLPIEYLALYLGDISEGSRGRMLSLSQEYTTLLSASREAVPREYTGTPIVNMIDFRKEYREYFLNTTIALLRQPEGDD
jgi:hypothetical protein